MATGRRLATVGALVAIVSFFLPWVSLFGVSVSGLDLASNRLPFNSLLLLLTSPVNMLLFLVPGLAFGVLLIVIVGIGKASDVTGSEWVLICSAIGAIGAGIAILRLYYFMDYGLLTTIGGHIIALVGAAMDLREK